MTPGDYTQDDLLIAYALLRYSCRLEDVEPERSDHSSRTKRATAATEDSETEGS